MSIGPTRPSRPNRNDAQTKSQRVARSQAPGPAQNKPRQEPAKREWKPVLFAAMFVVGALMLLGTVSGWLGYNMGERVHYAAVTETVDAYLASQFAQAVDDITVGNYVLAQERLAYILNVNPNYQPALDLLVDVEVVLIATATPTLLPATPTPSPTPDFRPADDQFASIQSMISLKEWHQALDMLANLRQNHPDYMIVEVDGLIFLGLRNRGIQKILNGELEGGIYDFTLAEQFGPLDGETENYRNWARLYLLGNAFWGAYPEQAAYYYGQLVSAAPSITDSSGVSAFYRYWASLLQIGEQLAKEEKWCESSEQMITVLGVWDQAYVYPTATWVAEQCLLGTPSVTPTSTITTTSTITPTITPGGPTISPTLSGTPPTATFTSSPGPTTETPTNTPKTPTNTPVTPTETPVPSAITEVP